MYVIKRNGKSEEIYFDKIKKRLEKLTKKKDELKNINVYELTQKVISSIKNNMKTTEIDLYSAEQSINMSISNYEYQILASRIITSNHHKNTLDNFSDKILLLHKYNNNIINNNLLKFSIENKEFINNTINYDRDYLIDFFGFKTLEKTYLFNIKENNINKIIERVQDMFMRVSISIHIKDKISEDILYKIKETYNLMSTKHFIHASPTLFNAGTTRQQLSSCFVLGVDDSIDSLMKLHTSTAHISKWGGGVGFYFSNIRSKGSIISSSNGRAEGIIPFIRMFNSLASCVNQGGKRLGSFAVFIETHHADIFDFLDLRKNIGDEKLRARDISLGLWVSDLFMNTVKNNGEWYLMDPNISKNLENVYGEEYEKLYMKYVEEKKYVKIINALDLWKAIWNSQRETGYPYICYKDIINKTSNQNNIGVIKTSNLCTEIMEHSSNECYSVCNLASIVLPTFVIKNNNNISFDYKKLAYVVGILVENLNNIIDINYYPVEETKISNNNNRPIGIGVSGLADVFLEFRMPFASEEAKDLNKNIFETIYYSALSKSTQLAKKYGFYKNYKGSRLSEGIFHFELYNKYSNNNIKPSNRWNWDSLRDHIKEYGVRNSLLIALMPTASTSQIMGSSECFEPYTSNIYRRKTLSGEFIVINKYLMKDVQCLGILNNKFIDHLKEYNGSVQKIEYLPQELKELYKTAYEISKKDIIDHSYIRQAFIDQSQSQNLYVDDLTFAKFCSIHFYAFEKKLKTGCYYMRTKSAVDPIKFTLSYNKEDNKINDNKIKNKINKIKITDDSDEDICLLCSS